MQCESFETRLNQLLDRRMRPETDDHLLAHAQRCEACRELLAVQELLFDGLELLERPGPSAGFSRRIVAESVRARPAAAVLPPRWLLLAASVAALLLVSVFTVPRFLPKKEGHAVTPAKTGHPLPSTAALVNPSRAPREPHSEPKLNPTAPSPSALADHDYRQMLAQIPRRFPEVQREALEIPGGLRPIATSFGVAVGLIRRTLPGGKEELPPVKPQAFLGEGLCPIA